MGGRLVRRILLIIAIVTMCTIVAVGGNITLMSSNGVLKNQKTKATTYKIYNIFVDITSNKLYLKDGNKVMKTYPISAGKPLTPSPIGTWRVISKARWNKGFGGFWMGFNVPWGKFGIHGTLEPWGIGNSVSHGCIRMYNKDIEELYKTVPMGTPVKIYGGPYGPFGEGFRTIKSGQFGSDVYEVERILKEKGYFHGYVNGIFDSSLVSAVYSFQKKHNMKQRDQIDWEFYKKLGVKLME